MVSRASLARVVLLACVVGSSGAAPRARPAWSKNVLIVGVESELGSVTARMALKSGHLVHVLVNSKVSRPWSRPRNMRKLSLTLYWKDDFEEAMGGGVSKALGKMIVQSATQQGSLHVHVGRVSSEQQDLTREHLSRIFEQSGPPQPPHPEEEALTVLGWCRTRRGDRMPP
jgi:hypothetical protein